MEKINGIVWWYQQKIGAYDKQLWEKSVEKTVIKNIEHVPRKQTKVKTDLIDVDLVRGSTFPKTKPKHSLWLVSIRGILRIVFLPLYLRWWKQQTSAWFGWVLMLLYIVQVGTLIVYCTDTGTNVNAEILSLAHLLVPVVLMVILGLMHSQMVATVSSHKHRRQSTPERNTTTKKKRKSTKKGSYQDTDINGHADSEEVDQFVQRKKKIIRRKSNGIDDASDHKRNRYKGNVKNMSSETSGVFTEDDIKVIEQDIPNIQTSSQKKCDANGAFSTNTELKCDKSSLGNCNINSNDSTDNNAINRQCKHKSNSVSTVLTKGQLDAHFDGDIVNSSNAMVNAGITDNNDIHFTSESDNERSNTDEVLTYKNDDHEGEMDVMCPSNEDLTVPIPGSEGVMMLPDVIDGSFDLSNELTIPCTSTQLMDNSQALELGCNKSDDEKVNNVSITQKLLRTNRQQVEEQVTESTNRNNLSDFEHIEELPIIRDQSLPDGSIQIEVKSKNSATSVSTPCGMSGKEEEGFTNIVGSITVINKLRRADTLGMKTEFAENMNDVFENKEVSSELDESYNNSEILLESPTNECLKRVKGNISSCESEGETTPNAPTPKGQTSEMEWDDDPINSADMSTDSSSQVTTETEISDDDKGKDSDGYGWSENLHHANSVMNNLASSTDKVSCIIWESEEVKKVDLTVLDLGWTIIQKADKMPEKSDYLLMGVGFSMFMSLLPVLFRIHQHRERIDNSLCSNITGWIEMSEIVIGENWREKVVILNGVFQRFFMSFIFFFLLSVAERTFKQRLLYAKHFCYLTSCRRAKKYDMPHFRLNKVRNIKTWLSLRSYLKKRGPQRSVDTIVSAAFFLAVVFVSLMCVELLHDSVGFLDHLGNWELMIWCMALGIYLLRFMTLGTDINKKYRNFSVLITEQINLYLHMEQKPHKKEELILANNVLKLAEALLKELESPFRISGLSVNPFLYNITKVFILSAFSAVLTELLGFKLKLYKIKLRA